MNEDVKSDSIEYVSYILSFSLNIRFIIDLYKKVQSIESHTRSVHIYFYSSIILITSQVLSYAHYNFGAITIRRPIKPIHAISHYTYLICESEIKINGLLARATYTIAVESIAGETFAT